MSIENQSTPDAERSSLEQLVRRAVCNPRAVTDRRSDETMRRWETRAVMVVVDELRQQRDDAVALVQRCAGSVEWPSHETVIGELAHEIHLLEIERDQTRGGGAQGGEDAAGKRQGRELTSNAELEPGHGTATPADNPRSDPGMVWLPIAPYDEVGDLRSLRLDVARLLGISHLADGLDHQQIRESVQNLLVDLGLVSWLHAESTWQHGQLHGAIRLVLAEIDDMPCLHGMCPGPLVPSPRPRCSLCATRIALRQLLDTDAVPTSTVADQPPEPFVPAGDAFPEVLS